MELLPVLVVVAALAAVIGRLASQFWIIRRYRAGQIARRSAQWLIFAISAAPFIALLAFMVIIDSDLWWLALLLFIASWPVIILPATIALDAPGKPQ